MSSDTSAPVRYRIMGMDCADDVAEIEQAARHISGVEEARVSLGSQLLTLRVSDATTSLPAVEQSVVALGYGLVPITDQPTAAGADQSHLTPAYRRALWIVAGLNAGYALIEIGGGFLADSQALKADALDFLGDGLITFLGIIAIGWGLRWRARAALIQGLFLGVLGLGVLANTIARLQSGYEPEAGLMSVFAFVALAVNVAAALVLLPHRTGDANVRAVWLFSRNDALGNVAVLIAAGLVAWSGTAWPDLAVAFVIAGLFLHSAWSIIGDARRDLQEAGAGASSE